MRAVVVDRLMEPSELRVSEVDAPKLWPGTMAVDIRAAGCNFFDILMCQGKYQVKPPFPFTPGAEVAGVVSELGPGVADVALGDRVFAGLSLGAFAERVAVPVSALHRMPAAMSFPEGAAFPVVYPT